MLPLREIQQAFAESMMGKKVDTVAEELCPTAGSPLRMVALYRRMIRNNYLQVLKVTYPALSRLVGKSYFQTLASGYLKNHPSTSGDLFPYGRFLPLFLEELAVSPWIAGVARLEWACHEACQAPDSPLLSSEQFQAIAAIDPSEVRIQFHPASRLLFFPHPAHRVWLALQPDAPADEIVDLPLPEEETGVLVTRPFLKVQVTPLEKTCYLLFEALYAGKDLASVYQMAIALDPEFELIGFFAELLKQQIVVGFSVGGPP